MRKSERTLQGGEILNQGNVNWNQTNLGVVRHGDRWMEDANKGLDDQEMKEQREVTGVSSGEWREGYK